MLRPGRVTGPIINGASTSGLTSRRCRFGCSNIGAVARVDRRRRWQDERRCAADRGGSVAGPVAWVRLWQLLLAEPTHTTPPEVAASDASRSGTAAQPNQEGL